MRIRLFCLVLVLMLMLPMVVGCKGSPKELTVDATYQIVYDERNVYASAAANLLCGALRKVLGERLDVVPANQFDPEEGGNAIYVGDTVHVTELPAIGENGFLVSLIKGGIVIRGADPMALYLAVETITAHWGVVEGYGTANEEGLPISKQICQRLNNLEIGRNEMLSVMSQNVRCADDGGKNDIDDRRPRLEQLIADYSPDLLGTQEVTKRWMGIFEESFGEEYGMIGCSRDGVTASSGEWNTILYKKERFDLIQSGTFWLTDTPDQPSMTEDALCRRICTWAILRDKLTDREVMFCNTHLDHSNDTVRDAQAKILMDFIDDYVAQYPVFLTGDFNTTYGKAPYLTVTKTLVDSHKQAEVDISEVKGTFHDYGKPGNEIDFCFYTGLKADPVAYRILSDDYDGFVSDHYGVISYFRYK